MPPICCHLRNRQPTSTKQSAHRFAARFEQMRTKQPQTCCIPTPMLIRFAAFRTITFFPSAPTPKDYSTNHPPHILSREQFRSFASTRSTPVNPLPPPNTVDPPSRGFGAARSGGPRGKLKLGKQKTEAGGRGGSSEAQSTQLTGRVVRALENRTRPSTLSIGPSLIRRPPGIAVSKAFLALRASECNGWPRRWGLAQGREWRRGKTCDASE